tara:strand:+ start:10351 stop:10503 length:153 start_codon:yes stop_codon:yes gene_type:complete
MRKVTNTNKKPKIDTNNEKLINWFLLSKYGKKRIIVLGIPIKETVDITVE